MNDNFTTVDVRDVERGDVLAGLPWDPTPVVESILLDCTDGLHWVFANPDHVIIARLPVDSAAQVLRYDDWCLPCGIARRLTVVR